MLIVFALPESTVCSNCYSTRWPDLAAVFIQEDCLNTVSGTIYFALQESVGGIKCTLEGS